MTSETGDVVANNSLFSGAHFDGDAGSTGMVVIGMVGVFDSHCDC